MIRRETNDGKVHVGLVGCGFIAQKAHIPALLASNASIKAVCDTNLSLAKEVAARYRIEKVYGSFAEMVSDQELEVVDICAPAAAHFPISSAALRAGKHVLVEKPAALSAREIDSIVELASSAETIICPVHNLLFTHASEKAKRIMARRRLGDVVNVNVTWSNRLPFEWWPDWAGKISPKQFLFEYSIHCFYCADYFLPNAEITGISHKRLINTPSLPTVSNFFDIRLENRASTGRILIFWGAPRNALTIDITGTESSLQVDIFRDVCVVYPNYGPSVASSLAGTVEQNVADITEFARNTLLRALNRASSHKRLIHHFIESVRNREEPPVSISNMKNSIRLVELLWERLKNDLFSPFA